VSGDASQAIVAPLGSARVFRHPFPDAVSPTEPRLLRLALREIGTLSPRDSRRLLPLQQLCLAGLDRRGGPECHSELPVAGGYGEDVWDVASTDEWDTRLCISGKAMTSSRHHNIGNRLRELAGEAAQLRVREPDAVLGFVCVIAAHEPGRIGGRVSRHSDQSIAQAIGARCGDSMRLPHHFDVGCVLRADLRTGAFRALRAPGLHTFAMFLDKLIELWSERRLLPPTQPRVSAVRALRARSRSGRRAAIGGPAAQPRAC
jgi:hypothetical protein